MPRRVTDIAMVNCPVTEVEAAVVGEMRAASGATSDANLIRIALWSLADHMGLEMPDGVFDLRWVGAVAGRSRARMQTAPNPKIRQDKPFHRRGATDSHPWRGPGPRTPPVLPEGPK